MKKEAKTLLGIIGGLGPMATVYFYEMLTSHTRATCDKDHIDIVISSRATTPDRTAFVLGKSSENPLDVMLSEAKKLETYGATLLSIPCNTAHYFYDSIAKSVNIPVINIIHETVSYIKRTGAQKIGVLATEGTIAGGGYEATCKKEGLSYVVPSEAHQAKLMSIIYDEIKQGKPADMDAFYKISDSLRGLGCDKIVLGCTELSLIKKDKELDDLFVDSLEVLAAKTIKECGKEAVGFSPSLIELI